LEKKFKSQVLVVLMLLDLIVLSMTQHRENWSHITSESATQFLYISHKFVPTKVFPICVSAAHVPEWPCCMQWITIYLLPNAKKKEKDGSLICL
jgi:hypothetical protein